MTNLYKSFRPFERSLDRPCILFCKWSACHHCQTMAPILKKVQTKLRNEIAVYVVDAENDSKVIEQLKVTGFPTIFVIKKNNRMREYEGPRDVDSIVKFAKTYVKS
jgi:thioredoxin-like negative regulator of GroEL